MIYYTIIGHRSKIGKAIKKGLPNNFRYISETHYHNKLHLLNIAFLAHNSDKNQLAFNILKNIKNLKIIDSSGFSKKNKIKEFKYNHYLIDKTSSNYISNPGCSAFGSILILEAIKKNLNFCHITCLFSTSAMSRNRQSKYDKNIQSVYELNHFHKKEIIDFTGIKNLTYVPYLTNDKDGITLDISGKLSNKINIQSILMKKYGFKISIVEDKNDCILTKDKIIIYVDQKNKDFFIKIKYSNLTVAGANSSIENALQLFKELK